MPSSPVRRYSFPFYRSALAGVDSGRAHTGFTIELEATARDNDPTDHTAYVDHRTALEMYAFLLQWFVTAAEKHEQAKLALEGIGAGGKRVRRPGSFAIDDGPDSTKNVVHRNPR